MSRVLSYNIDFGSSIGEVFKDASGNDLIEPGDPAATSSFTFKLGTFSNEFVPTISNTEQWLDNWKTFEVTNFNAPPQVIGTLDAGLTSDGLTVSQHPLADIEYDFFGAEAYLWIYNSYDFEIGTEWFLGRSADWFFPEADPALEDCAGCLSEFPTEWAISNIAGSDVPVWGGQSGVRGGGFYDETDDEWELQTFGVIPEPSAIFLIAAIGAIVFTHRFNPFKRRRS